MEFRILGPLEVADGDAVVPLAGVKQRALLALLLLNANQIVSADRLIDELWPGQSPEAGRAALQVRVSQLRKALGDGGGTIITRPPGYLAAVGRDELDLHRFELLVEEADPAEPAVAGAKLREALGLWRGPPLADIGYEAFAQNAIRRLEELRLAALEKRIDADLTLGRHADVIAELETLVTEHPLRERLRIQLMLALYRCGRQADALAVYQATRRALVEELGIEPSPPLRELEQAILRQDRSLDLAAVPSPARSILVVALAAPAFAALLTLATPLARRPERELILTRLIDRPLDLPAEGAAVNERRELLLAAGITARAAAFTSTNAGADAVRMAAELDCDLLLVDAPPQLLASPVLQVILASAPSDVAVLVGREPTPGPLLVPFVGAEHDWAAIELGAWLASSWNVPLRIAGQRSKGATQADCSPAPRLPSNTRSASPPNHCCSPPAPKRSPMPPTTPRSSSSAYPTAGRPKGSAPHVARSLSTPRPQRCSSGVACAPAASRHVQASPVTPGHSSHAQLETPGDRRADGKAHL